MQKKNATLAIIGAGDFIGGEIAKKLASEGFYGLRRASSGREAGALVKETEAAGGTVFGRALDARKEDDFVADGAAETYSFMCIVTHDAAFVQRTMN